jgi:ankyrin repeat protein
MYASIKGKTDTVALLLDKGANIEAEDRVRIPQHSTLFQSLSS